MPAKFDRLALRFVSIFIAAGLFMAYQWTVPYHKNVFEHADLLLLSGSLILGSLLTRQLRSRIWILLILVFICNAAGVTHWLLTKGLAGPSFDEGGLVGRLIGLTLLAALLWTYRDPGPVET